MDNKENRIKIEIELIYIVNTGHYFLRNYENGDYSGSLQVSELVAKGLSEMLDSPITHIKTDKNE